MNANLPAAEESKADAQPLFVTRTTASPGSSLTFAQTVVYCGRTVDGHT